MSKFCKIFFAITRKHTYNVVGLRKNLHLILFLCTYDEDEMVATEF